MQKFINFLDHHLTVKTAGVIMFLLMLAWSGLLVARKIDLTTADLGRHIMNGEIIVTGAPADVWAVLHTNFYSYTNTNFPFINHHWLTGVVFYLLYQAGGFNLLSIFYIVFTVITFAIFFRLAQKQSNTLIAAILSVLLLPIITSRKEIRPEVFSYLFCGIYYWLLWQWRQLRLTTPDSLSPASGAKVNRPLLVKEGRAWLYLLPLIMVLWVNLHIEFIIGIGVIGVFWVEQVWRWWRKQTNELWFLTLILLLSTAATLFNPSTWRGAIYPFFIFSNYGYTVVENQNIFFLQRLHADNGLYVGLFEAMIVLGLLSLAAVIVWRRNKFVLPNFLLLITFSFLAADAVRDFPLFGLFAVPIIATNVYAFVPSLPTGVYRKLVGGIMLAIILGGILRFTQNLNEQGEIFGIGLMPGELSAANFFKANQLQGPFFNNYDVGGYLIFNLFPQEKVFVDNRPEAYPASFLQNIYIPAQEDPAKWQALDSQYNFNAIFFYYHDLTPWAQQFLIARVQDPAWAPVYVDSYNIIFLKRNSENAELIKKYELPKSMFGISG